MPPPANAAPLPSSERMLQCVQAQQVKGHAPRAVVARPANRRVVHDKDFLQRLREAGL